MHMDSTILYYRVYSTVQYHRVILGTHNLFNGCAALVRCGMCSEGLRPLVEYIDILGRSMESKLKAGGRKEDLVPLARQVRNMFVALDEYDKARGIAKLFSLKEAL